MHTDIILLKTSTSVSLFAPLHPLSLSLCCFTPFNIQRENESNGGIKFSPQISSSFRVKQFSCFIYPKISPTSLSPPFSPGLLTRPRNKVLLHLQFVGAAPLITDTAADLLALTIVSEIAPELRWLSTLWQKEAFGFLESFRTLKKPHR